MVIDSIHSSAYAFAADSELCQLIGTIIPLVRLLEPLRGCTPKPPKSPSRSRTTSESPGADAVVLFMADPAVSGNTCLATGLGHTALRPAQRAKICTENPAALATMRKPALKGFPVRACWTWIWVIEFSAVWAYTPQKGDREDRGGRRIPIHDGHLAIHEHRCIGVAVRPESSHATVGINRLSAGGDHSHTVAELLPHAPGNGLIDGIVLGQ